MVPIVAFVAMAAMIAIPATVTPPSEPEGSSDPADSAPPITVNIPKTIPGVPPTIPGSVPEHASFDQLVAAAQTMSGSSADMLGEFTGLLDVPDGIPTPAGSNIVEFSLRIEPSDDPDDSYYYGQVSFTSTATADDIAEYYETLLPSAGYSQTGDSTTSDEYGRSQELEFDNPTAVYSYADITVAISETSDAEAGPAVHELRWYADAEVAWLDHFDGWTPGLPLPADATAVEATLRTSSFLDINSMTVEVVYELPTTDPEANPTEFESLLPVAGYAIDPESDGDEWTAVTGPGIDQLTIYWSEGYPGGARARVSGRVVT